MFPKPIFILGILGLILVAVALPFAMDPFMGSAKTDTESFKDGCSDQWRGYGRFPDLPGDQLKYGELFDGTKVLTTWLADGKSQKVVVEAKIRGYYDFWCGSYGSPDKHRYVFEINTGSGFKPLINDAFPDGDYIFTESVETGYWDLFDESSKYKMNALKFVVFQIDGVVPDGAILRTTYEAYIGHGTPTKWDWHKMASDELVLRQGIPLVEWGANQYPVGENAILRTEIPFVHFDDGNFTEYYLSVYNENTGDNCKDSTGLLLDRTPIEKIKKTWTVPVTAEMFVVTAECQNRLRAVVRNELLNADQDDTSVIDIAGYGPTVTEVDSDKGEYEEGDGVTITWDAEPNPTTKLEIVKYHVTAQIGGLVLMDADTTDKTAFFIAPTAGFLEIEVTAYDEGCRPSEVVEIVLEVGNVLPKDFCLEHPNDPICGGKDEGIPWAKIILTIGIIILGFFLGLVAYHFLGLVDEKWGAIGLVICVVGSWIAAAVVWL